MRRLLRFLAALAGALAALGVAASPAWAAGRMNGMARIPGGRYVPLYGTPSEVAAFALDREPVIRGDFLRFVRAHAEWRRAAVTAAKAERGYLAEWRSDLDAGDARDLRRPVSSVSRIAAAAYCEAQNKRLPTTAEWEYAAALPRPAVGLAHSGDPAWEWTRDDMSAHHHHAHHDMSCIGSAVGASDPTNYAAFLRYAFRGALTDQTTSGALGFRCAISL